MADPQIVDDSGKPLPSWKPGEPIPADMPEADSGAKSASAKTDPTKDLADIQRRKMEATDKTYGELGKTLEQDKATVAEAARHAGVEPGLPPAWNEEYESAKRQTDPIQAFASLGSVFGILASAFTHAPMENALNASAAAINAVKQGNAQDYDRAYKAWQDNTKLALDRHKIMQDHYSNAIELLKTDMAAGEAQLRVQAARFGDQRTLFLLEHGLDKEFLELQQSRDKLATDMELNHAKVVMANAEVSRLFALGYDAKDPTSEKSQKALIQFQAERAKLKALEHPTIFGSSKSAIAARAEELMKPKAEGGEGLSEPDALMKATQEFKQKSGAGASINGETLDFMADQAASGDLSVFSGLGWGAAGAANRVALRERIRQRHPELSGEQLARINAAYKAFAAGQTSEARAAGTRAGQLAVITSVLKTAIPQARTASEALSRSDWVSFNKAIQAGQTEFSDPAIKKFDVGNLQLAELWARAMNPTGVMRESDRALALSILRRADSQKAYEQALKSLEEAVQREQRGIEKAREELPGGNLFGKSGKNVEADPLGIR